MKKYWTYISLIIVYELCILGQIIITKNNNMLITIISILGIEIIKVGFLVFICRYLLYKFTTPIQVEGNDPNFFQKPDNETLKQSKKEDEVKNQVLSKYIDEVLAYATSLGYSPTLTHEIDNKENVSKLFIANMIAKDIDLSDFEYQPICELDVFDNVKENSPEYKYMLERMKEKIKAHYDEEQKNKGKQK
jgi:hypothetical protein